MCIYICNYLLLIIYMILYLKTNNRKMKNFIFLLSVLQLILVQGLRNINLGSDMPFYWMYYDNQLSYSIFNLGFSRFEILFKFLTKIISSISTNKQLYLLIISFLSNIPISILVFKKSKNPIMSLLLFLSFGFYNFNFSGLRQAIAFAITFYSYKYIVDKKIIKFILSILCAYFFHSSALVFLPAYFLYNFKITKLKIFSIVIFDVFVYIYKIPIFSFFNSLFYENYNMVITNSVNWMLMCLFIVFVCLFFYKKIESSDSSLLYNLVILGSSIMLLSPIANNILRISNYYFMFIILLIPEIIYSLKSFKNRLFIGTFSILLAFSLYIYLLYVDSYNIVPYIFGTF